MSEAAAEREAIAWVFEDVRIEPASRRLFVGGRERACSRRAFDLLLRLAERPRVVHARDELIDLLWPGGQIVPDEALTQAVFRLRAALGSRGERVTTVRGIGVRLDADVERIGDGIAPATPADDACGSDAADAPAAAAASIPAPPAARPPRRRRPWPRPAALIVVIAALAATWWLTRTPADELVDAGYGLRTADVHAEHAATVRLVADAFALEGAGRRADATAMLEVAHESDARTPLPALFLALWATGEGDAEAADRWLPQAAARARPLADPYLAALLRYLEAERRGEPREVLSYAAAVLKLRPHAWQMHLARSHLLNYQGLREAALAEMAKVEVVRLDHRKLAMALADRASLGDLAGAEAAFARLPVQDTAEYHFLAGRLAWSRGDAVGAQAAFLHAAERGRVEDRIATVNRALTYAGVLAMNLGRSDEAIAHLERARAGVEASRQWLQYTDVALILAQLRFEAGDRAAAAHELRQAQDAAQRAASVNLQAMAALFAHRMGVDGTAAPADAPAIPRHLLAARAAVAAGEGERAAAELDAAIHLGAQEVLWLDETALLLAELGRPVPPLPAIDPPYPPLSRWATRRALAAQTAQHPLSP